MVTSNIRLTGDTSNLTNSLDQVKGATEQTTDKFKDLSDAIRNLPTPNVDSAYNNQNVQNVLNAQAAQSQVVQTISQQYGNSQLNNNSVGGNVSGGAVQGGSAGGSKNFLAGIMGGGGLTKALAAAGPVGMAIAAVVGGVKIADNLEKKWEEGLPNILDTYNSFGNISGNTAEQNSENIRNMFDQINRTRNGDNVRFSTEDYISTMQQMKGYGYSDTNGALNAVSEILKFENAGMGSRAQLMEVLGSANRFGLSGALNQAYGGLVNSGMEKGQLDEFLSSMEEIFEDGISKGFVKGYDEISSDLTLLENLSGNNPLWQGQYGAANLRQMNSAVENATGLGSVNDVIMYQAIAGMDENEKRRILKDKYNSENGYINNMLLLEQGLTTDTMGPILKALKETGGSRQDQIERLMRTFGLNYSKATDLYTISQNYTDEKAEDVKRLVSGSMADTNADSVDRQVLEDRENISNQVKSIGSDLSALKEGTLNFEAKLLGAGAVNETKEIGMIPVSGEEVNTWNALIESYAGPLSQEEFYQKINDYFNDESVRSWADTFNFQNAPGLKEAWDSKNGTLFFTNLFDDTKFTNTAYGPMTLEDMVSVWSDKDFNNKKGKIKKNTDYATNEDLIMQYLAARKEFDPTYDPTLQSMAIALREIAAFARTKEVIVKTAH